MSIMSLFSADKATELTSFFSLEYLAFFLPAAILVYAIFPRSKRRYVLLAESLCFFWLISGKLVAYLILTAFSMHWFGMWIDRIYRRRDEIAASLERSERRAVKKQYTKKARCVLAFAAVLHIGTLLLLKYSAFAVGNLNSLFELFGAEQRIAVPNYALPIGLSFFTLQAVSYIVDVYREKVNADENLCRLALWISFFPQIIEGPICRYSQTADRLWQCEGIKFDNMTLGIQRILFGMLKKIVVADRLNSFVSNVFTDYKDYGGGIIALAAVCYTIQLYMDFSGSMDAVAGTAQIFGIEMPENFKRPFFSKTITEFWKRWHISLGEWFRDYLFYPVTMSKPMQSLTKSARKKLGNHFGPLIAGSIALFCVWFCNGLWHGAAWNYIFFGLYHFALILTGRLLAPLINAVNGRLHIDPQKRPYRIMQIIRSDILIVIGELFFRADGVRAGLYMFKKAVTDFSFSDFSPELFGQLGIDYSDFLIVGVTVAIVFAVGLINEKGICIRKELKSKNVALRWSVIYAMIMFIVIFGAYGVGYMSVDPMYADF